MRFCKNILPYGRASIAFGYTPPAGAGVPAPPPCPLKGDFQEPYKGYDKAVTVFKICAAEQRIRLLVGPDVRKM